MKLKKNDELSLDITGVTQEGSGVGRIEGMVIFVPGCVTGDKVQVRIVGIRTHFAYGKLLCIKTPSPARISIDCSVFPRCGGCAFRHIDYSEELRIKEKRVSDALQHIAGLSVQLAPIMGCQKQNCYRNKAQLPVGKNKDGQVIFGFYASRSHRIVSIDDCLLQPPVFKKIMQAFRQWIKRADVSIYNEQTGKGLLRHIFLRQASTTGELMACAVINGSTLPQVDDLIQLCKDASPQLTSLVLNQNKARTNVILGDRCQTIWGKDKITDILCELKLSLQPHSFYQVNSPQAALLYQEAMRIADLKPTDTLLDLYCGIGTIGLCMAKRVKQVIGVEVVAAAVADAKENAEQNHIPNAVFYQADAGDAADRLMQEGTKVDVVVVDPPRKGLQLQTIKTIARMVPSRVIYISCNPETLARDLVIFSQNGYKCTYVRPFDLFPRTAHVETCVLLSKKTA